MAKPGLATIARPTRRGGRPRRSPTPPAACRFAPSPHGTWITLREDGFLGQPQAAHGNAENWEMVLGWLDAYLSAGRSS